MEEVIFEITDKLNRAMALTRSIRERTAEGDEKTSDLGLVAEVATGLIQSAYNKIGELPR